MWLTITKDNGTENADHLSTFPPRANIPVGGCAGEEGNILAKKNKKKKKQNK